MPEVQEVANVLLGSRDKDLGRLRAASIAQLRGISPLIPVTENSEIKAASLLSPSGINLGKEKNNETDKAQWPSR